MRLPCPTSTVRPVSSERHAPDRGREAGWRAGLSGRAVPRGCPGVRRVDRGGRQRAFRRSFATLQPRMIVPRLTPLRVTLGTIACQGAAVGVRYRARSSSADPTSPAVSALAACGIFWLSRKPATRDSCRCHRSGRSRKEAASRWPSLCTWPRKPRERAEPSRRSPARRGGTVARTADRSALAMRRGGHAAWAV